MALSIEKNPILLDYLNSDRFSGSYSVLEDLSKHTSYNIGGPASVWCECESVDDIIGLVQACHSAYIEWEILGSGTNMLVNDKGFNGVVIHLGEHFKEFEYDSSAQIYKVGCATTLAKVVNDAYENGRSGLEFGMGIPGTIGGAIRMNAGTSLGSIQQCLKSVEYLREDGKVTRKSADEIEWEYRNCILPNGCVILRAEISVSQLENEEDIANMRAEMDEKRDKRKNSQPVNKHSCGSVFKNPDGDYAGRLIDETGLKRYKKGGAEISEVHGNFIVNNGNATARDVITLMNLVQNRVYDNFGVRLHAEVRFLGFEAFPLSF